MGNDLESGSDINENQLDDLQSLRGIAEQLILKLIKTGVKVRLLWNF